MRREKQLDELLEQRGRGMVQTSALHADDAAKIAAAESFVRLNDIEIPDDVAQRIEARVRSHAHALQAERQLARQRRAPQRRFVMRRAWIAAFSTAMLLLLALAGVGNVAANSLPGDSFYSIKQFEQRVAVDLAGSQNARISLQLTQLQQAITDLNTVTRGHRPDAAVSQALASVAAQTRACQQAIAALPEGQQKTALAQTLASTLNDERASLYRLLPQVNWAQRLAFTRQLGALGETIPMITTVTVSESSGNTLILTITGKNFTPGARLYIDGLPRGTVLQNTSTMLSARINAADLSHHASHSIGIINANGTAAQSMAAMEQDHPMMPGATPGPGNGDHPTTPGTPGTGDMHGEHR